MEVPLSSGIGKSRDAATHGAGEPTPKTPTMSPLSWPAELAIISLILGQALRKDRSGGNFPDNSVVSC
jgi:hypothetical protein